MTPDEHSAYVQAVAKAADRLGMPAPSVPPAEEIESPFDPKEYVLRFANIPDKADVVDVRFCGNGELTEVYLRAVDYDDPFHPVYYSPKRIEWEQDAQGDAYVRPDFVMDFRDTALLSLLDLTPETVSLISDYYGPRALFGMWFAALCERIRQRFVEWRA